MLVEVVILEVLAETATAVLANVATAVLADLVTNVLTEMVTVLVAAVTIGPGGILFADEESMVVPGVSIVFTFVVPV